MYKLLRIAQANMLALTLTFIALCSVEILDASTMYVIIITDTDPRIGSLKDKVLMTDMVDRIGDITEMTVVKKIFNKRDTGIKEAIDRLNPRPDDVVWVYYSGHGRNSGDGWPQFTSNNFKFTLTKMKEKIQSKGARLNIVMYDSCNYGVTTRPVPGHRLTPAALDILFNNSRGTIIASSAGATNYAHGSPQIGGFFTVSFLDALQSVSPADGTNLWKVVMEKAKQATNAMCRQIRKSPQNPIFEIDINGDSINSTNTEIAPEKENLSAVDPWK